MISKDEFMEQFGRVFRSAHGLRQHTIAHAKRDWTIGLVVGVAMVVGSGVWGSVIYFSYEDLTRMQSAESSDVIVYREEQVDRALALIAEQNAISSDLTEKLAVPQEEVVPETASSSEPEPAVVEVPIDEGSPAELPGEAEMASSSADSTDLPEAAKPPAELIDTASNTRLLSQ